jgi:uncharacterized Ntn-hydrolase superfamily protein
MKTKSIFTIILLALFIANIQAQDTFSIVAVDSITGEVGSAGASCVDMDNFPGYQDDFLGELFPGVGAINTQAWYLASNQVNARNRMNMGETPSQIIDWLVNNDAQNQPQKRQYGIVAMVNGSPESAAHTGTSTDDYKNHITGPNYSIQGNILLGQIVLDSMEHRFLNAEGDLACKLMAALQGAKMVGADSRCHSNGTSSLFSFVKVAQPDDTFGNPSFLLSVRTHDNAGIEPIDSLQTLFNEVHDCGTVGVNKDSELKTIFSIYPNPTNDFVTIKNYDSKNYKLKLLDITGKIILESIVLDEIKLDISSLSEGIYVITLENDNHTFTRKVIKK